MKVALAYGRGRLLVDVPAQAVVITPQELPGIADERAAFDTAVRAPIGSPPLRDLAKPTDTVAIVIADITRPVPSDRLVPWIMGELAHSAAPAVCDRQRHRLAPGQHPRGACADAGRRGGRDCADRQP